MRKDGYTNFCGFNANFDCLNGFVVVMGRFILYWKNNIDINIIKANTDLSKMVPIEILLNFVNYFRTFTIRNCFYLFLSTYKVFLFKSPKPFIPLKNL